ncbi:hypothetical protein NIES4072_29600 [Nostoc commune NIES-4072]|uniref:Uncharacterized protein n=1 Tax=Nostoc commune NIES-4072 TaxID=2005467 RepID=A0A2R5FSX3_NOSCO|nr:hypothetical protein NIES4070_61150 [Nostoc commune HK-02]GBG19293.1 hypothetical protein NIES4072_29600 [Nostoc commune NIES-4072]
MGILDLYEPLKCYRFCGITTLRIADLTLESLLDELKRDRAKRYRASELALPSVPPKSFHPLHDTTVNTQEFDPSQYRMALIKAQRLRESTDCRLVSSSGGLSCL